MQILEREVTAYKYSGIKLINAYVNLKTGDCQREIQPQYRCFDNCEGKFVIARFENGQPFSIKALVTEEISIHPQLSKLIAPTLSGLEDAAKKSGYSLNDYNKGKVLYLNGQIVASYNPCGLSNEANLWSPEVKQTVNQLVENINPIERIAEQKPLDALLDDKAFARQLDNPQFIRLAETVFGPQMRNLIGQFKEMRIKRN